jgi:hypothetical protein
MVHQPSWACWAPAELSTLCCPFRIGAWRRCPRPLGRDGGLKLAAPVVSPCQHRGGFDPAHQLVQCITCPPSGRPDGRAFRQVRDRSIREHRFLSGNRMLASSWESILSPSRTSTSAMRRRRGRSSFVCHGHEGPGLPRPLCASTGLHANARPALGCFGA